MQYLDARKRMCRSHRWPNDGCQPRSDRDVSGPALVKGNLFGPVAMSSCLMRLIWVHEVLYDLAD